MVRPLHPAATPRVLPQAPAELLAAPLARLGEGIGKVVYASPHWVVKRHRDEEEILALIVIWKTLRRFERLLPRHLRGRLLLHPAPQLRYLKNALYAALLFVPRGLWYFTHAGSVFHQFRHRDRHGEMLARTHLAGTGLIPETITFPPIRVQIDGWPGSLRVSEASERVDSTLHDHLSALAAAGDWPAVDHWLARLATGRGKAWRRGVFSTDAHLKNYGIIGDRLVLIDSGGLTRNWDEIEAKLHAHARDEAPHLRLGLASILAPRPDLAARFDQLYRQSVNPDAVRRAWPAA